MFPVYLSHPFKQFSGSRESLKALALRGITEAVDAGARPALILLASAHPLEFGDIDGEELARQVAEALRPRRLGARIEYFANPGLRNSSAHLAASATGAAVFHEAARRIATGEAVSVLAVGVEQMRLKGRDRTTQILQSLIHDEERRYGVTMPALGALLEGNLAREFAGLGEVLDDIMFANRARAARNPRAHIRKEFSRSDSGGPKNPMVSSPLRLWDVAPTSSGYAGILLSRKPSGRPVEVQVAGLGQGHDAVALGRRPDLYRAGATREALAMLLSDLGWTVAELRRRVRFAEIHDAFPIIEFLGLLDTGLLERGEILDSVRRGEIGPEGRLPVNLSGGVMGGHPVGATGLGQIVELYLHSTGGAGETPRARLGYSLAFNVGGPLTYNFLTLLRARERSGLEEIFWLPARPAFHAADFDLEGPPPLALPCAGRMLAQTLLHVPPPGFEAPVGLAFVEAGGRARLASCSGTFRPGSRVWLVSAMGGLAVRSGPGIDALPAFGGGVRPPAR